MSDYPTHLRVTYAVRDPGHLRRLRAALAPLEASGEATVEEVQPKPKRKAAKRTVRKAAKRTETDKA